MATATKSGRRYWLGVPVVVAAAVGVVLCLKPKTSSVNAAETPPLAAPLPGAGVGVGVAPTGVGVGEALLVWLTKMLAVPFSKVAETAVPERPDETVAFKFPWARAVTVFVLLVKMNPKLSEVVD